MLAKERLSSTKKKILPPFVEGIAIARQSDIVRKELAGLYGQFREALYDGLSHWAGNSQKLISPVLPLRGLAALFTGILDGMSFQFITVPGLTQDDEIWNTLQKATVLLLKSDYLQSVKQEDNG